MPKSILTFAIFIFLSPLLIAQSDCYDTFLSKGKKWELEGDFDRAIIQYKAAQVCSNLSRKQEIEILKVIESAQNNQMVAVKAALARAQQAEQKALQQAAIAESRRLLYIVKQLTEEKNFDQALQLARVIREKIHEVMPSLWYEAFMSIYRVKDEHQMAYVEQSLNGHTQYLNAVAYSPDNQYIITASKDSSSVLWKSSGEIITRLSKQEHPIVFAFFSPDSQYILTAARNGLAKIWDLWNSKGEHIATLDNPNFDLLASFSPDSRYIVTTSGIWATIWSISGEMIHNFQANPGGILINAIHFSPDGKSFFTAAKDGKLKSWDLEANLLQEWQAHGDEINSLVFSPDGQQILTASRDSTAKIWNLQGELQLTLGGHAKGLRSAIFSPKQESILTIAENGRAKTWDSKGKQLANFTDNETFPSIKVGYFFPDGKRILTGSNSSAEIWDLSGTLLSHLPEHYQGDNSLALSPDGLSVTMISSKNSAKIWRVPTQFLADPDSPVQALISQDKSKKKQGIFPSDKQMDQIFNSMSIKKEGAHIGAGTSNGQHTVNSFDDGTALVYDVSGKQLAELDGHTGRINKIDISKFGPHTAVFSNDSTAKIWTLSGELLTELKWQGVDKNYHQFTPDGKHFAMAFEDGSVQLWNFKGELLTQLSGHSRQISSIRCSPHNQILVVESKDSSAKIWNYSGDLLLDQNEEVGGFKRSVFSPDGQILALITYDSTLVLLDTKGTLLLRKQLADREINSVSFSQSNQHLAVGILEKHLEIWDISGKLILTLGAEYTDIRSVVFSPDEQYFVTLGESAKIWNLTGQLLGDLSRIESGLIDFKFLLNGTYYRTRKFSGDLFIWPMPQTITSWLEQHPLPPVSDRIKEKYDIEKLE